MCSLFCLFFKDALKHARLVYDLTTVASMLEKRINFFSNTILIHSIEQDMFLNFFSLMIFYFLVHGLLFEIAPQSQAKHNDSKT